MRILQICNKAPYPTNDGSSIAIYNIARGFIDNGAELHLLTINTKKHFKDIKNVPEEFLRKSNYKDVYRNTDVTAVGALLNLFGSDSYFVSRFIFKEFEEAIIEQLTQNTFDVVHLEGLFVAPYLDVIKKHSKAKITIRTHNVEHLIWERLINNETNPIKRYYLKIQNKRLKKLELELLRKVDGIIPITAYDKLLLEDLGIGSQYFVSPTGIVLEKYPITKNSLKPNSVFSLASMDWMPNVEAVEWFIDKVWGPFLKNNRQVKCTVAGRFMPKHLLDRSETNLNIIGEVNNNINFYNEHEIMLVPLQSGSGMRIKIIEGLALGKVIVSTGIGAEGIPVTHRENIIIADKPEEFANAIIELIQNPELKNSIALNARKFIEDKFNNKSLVGELLDFYKNLIA